MKYTTLAALTLAVGLAGCASMPDFFGTSSTKVSFANTSDSTVNVSFYVQDTTSSATNGQFVSDTTLQVAPGETTNYKLTRNAGWKANNNATVHVQVKPVAPSWDSTTEAYWLELLTQPPVSIVATSNGDTLDFNASAGQIALIPNNQIDGGRFEHRMATVTTNDQAE